MASSQVSLVLNAKQTTVITAVANSVPPFSKRLLPCSDRRPANRPGADYRQLRGWRCSLSPSNYSGRSGYRRAKVPLEDRFDDRLSELQDDYEVGGSLIDDDFEYAGLNAR
jgi:hypothetical protein